jgi:hypothetical protein
MDYGQMQTIDMARVRQAEILREAQQDRLIRLLDAGQPGPAARMRRMIQDLLNGRRQRQASAPARQRLAH